MDVQSLLCLWGKTQPDKPGEFHPLIYHMLDVAAVCEALVSCFGEVAPLPRPWLAYIAALHDIGKADPFFQNKAPALSPLLEDAGFKLSADRRPFRHEARSADWLFGHLVEQGGWEQSAAGVVAAATRGHHGRFTVGSEPEDPDRTRAEQWLKVRERLASLLVELLSIEPWRVDRFDNASVTGVKLSGTIVLADWIASNEQLFHHPLSNCNTDLAQYLLASREEANHAIRRLNFENESEIRPDEAPSFQTLWPGCTYLRPCQRAVEEQCFSGIEPGLAIIEAPMGEGKTEAAIYLAEFWQHKLRKKGAYIALPTAATSNQMHARYANFLERLHPEQDTPRLVHGMAWLLDEIAPTSTSITDGDDSGPAEEASLSREWFQPAKRALLAANGVGTIDQALMAALNVRHGFLRIFGLSSKILIIDEVHAYDEYMTTILKRLLEWCGALQVPVVMLSATLSWHQKRQLAQAYSGQDLLPALSKAESYPLLTFVGFAGQVRRVAVAQDRFHRRRTVLRAQEGLLNDPQGIAELALREVAHGGCACIIANTVKAAQSIYRALKQLHPSDTELRLFHARFRAEQRQELEQQVVSLFGKDTGKAGSPARPRRAILVATQVVEQSLDVDFDVMLTQLAPIDLLLQRSGRLHRHERGERPTGPEPVMHILLPKCNTEGFAFAGTGRVYYHEPLLRTLALLHGRESFDLPEDFRPLIESCYSDAPVSSEIIPPELLKQAADDRQKALAYSRDGAHTHLVPAPSSRVFSLAQQPSQPVDEGDGTQLSYFHAQTRQGEQTVTALVIHDASLLQAARLERSPAKHIRKRIFLQQVNLPAYWQLAELTVEAGFEPIFEGENWLHHHFVIPMKNTEWRGRDKEGNLVTLRDDSELGLLRMVEGSSEGSI